MDKLKSYVKKYLSVELYEIENSPRNGRLKHLNSFEKALIYKYTNDGCFLLNENLIKNKGQNTTEYGTLLESAINKLDNFEGLVYRSVNLDKLELDIYQNVFNNSISIIEYPFLSTSKSRLIAMQYNGNVLFRIFSKRGKKIEEISKFGLESQNEKEVIFSPNTNFTVLDVTIEGNYTLITMEEL